MCVCPSKEIQKAYKKNRFDVMEEKFDKFHSLYEKTFPSDFTSADPCNGVAPKHDSLSPSLCLEIGSSVLARCFIHCTMGYCGTYTCTCIVVNAADSNSLCVAAVQKRTRRRK